MENRPNIEPGFVFDNSKFPIHIGIIGDIGVTCQTMLEKLDNVTVVVIDEKTMLPSKPKSQIKPETFLITSLPTFNAKFALREPKPFYHMFNKKRKKKRK